MAVRCDIAVNGFHGAVATELDGNQPALLDEEWPHNWPSGVLTYRLNNLSLDIEKKKWQERAVTVAFRVWGLRIKDLKFKREYDPNKHVDCNISFRPLSYFGGRKGVLAHAWYPGQGEISGDIEINDEWNWVPGVKWSKLSTPPLVPILIHEIGHGLGLRHDTRSMDSIMYPSFDLGKKKNTLNDNDIFRIQSRYGKRTLSQRLIDYFIKRRTDGRDYR